MAAIALVDVGKTYPNGHIAARDLRLDIADGELMVLVGPSGSGKSTALRLIAGLETPTVGRIMIGEDDVTAVPPQERDLAMVFQSYALYPHKTVRANLAFPLRMHGLARADIDERVRRVAASLDITELLDRKPAQLSGGQRQRVALGRAAVREPRAFLFDEPLSNLDPALRVHTRAELALLHRRLGATMVYVTHDQEEAMTLGDRIAVMRDGALQQVAPPMELYRRPGNVFVASFIGSPAMNFFHCEPADDGRRLACAAFSLPFDTPATATGPVTLGVRPQDLELVAGEDGADANGTVRIVEPLGSELRIHLNLDRADERDAIIVVVPPDTPVAVEERIGVRLPRDRLHLFDADTERRVNTDG
ncbi:MAG: ABC transporter ATP-binding protein [Longimicrobiales bacterium]